MSTVGITALVPPELIFACGKQPFDVNNVIPLSRKYPKNKLCAWSAIWREMLVEREINVDALVVVAGGDCHNALVDGQRVAITGIPTHFFFYPFDGDVDYLRSQLYRLSEFLGGIKDNKKFHEIEVIKKLGKDIDEKRCRARISSSKAFQILISFSDLSGDMDALKKRIEAIKEEKIEFKSRVALIGVPPIYHDFHDVAQSMGLHVVFDELPYEFIRHHGKNMEEIAESYSEYTFARQLEFRIEFLQKELEKRKVDGVIHYTQFACHHTLEDEVLRAELDYPILTLQGDLPKSTPEQLKLRLEAFREVLERT